MEVFWLFTRSRSKTQAIMVWLILISISIFLVTGASRAESIPERGFSIDMPSQNERVLGEKRDFYVMGTFGATVDKPGNIRIELFRGSFTDEAPIRLIESSVDEITGMTPSDAFEQNYPQGVDHGLTRVPDLIKVPGGLFSPGNKVLVNETSYIGFIQGGATKDFDTSYSDLKGNPLIDLIAGPYTIRVTGLSGDIQGCVQTKKIWFIPSEKILGRFKPKEHVDKITAYAREHNLRLYFDLFPGYFWFGNIGYEINNRWRANNALEVVNTSPGIALFDKSVSAKNNIVIYNISETCATQYLELGTIIQNDLLDHPNTQFLYYDIGEPILKFFNEQSQMTHAEGNIVPFPEGKRMVLNRAELTTAGEPLDDNLMIAEDQELKEMDTDLSDGVVLDAGEELALYGVVKPIPSSVSLGDYTSTYQVENRITQVHYRITDATGKEILNSTREITLQRAYDPSDLTKLSPSIYEFKHEFILSAPPGVYTIKMTGWDKNGVLVPGCDATLLVNLVSKN